MSGKTGARMCAAVLAAIAAVTVTACGSGGQDSASAEPRAEQAVIAEDDSPVSGVGDEPECADLTGQEALDRWVDEVPTIETATWSRTQATVEDYDPCLPLSWIVIFTEAGHPSSPDQVMLFHRGEFVGPALDQPTAYWPTVERIDDETIEATWSWVRPGETVAGRTGHSTARFHWDEDQGRVIAEGDLSGRGEQPSYGESDADGREIGGPIPRTARQIGTIKPQLGGVAVFRTPSKNIGCAIHAAQLECRISSYNDDVPYGRDRNGGAIDQVIVSGGVAAMDYHGSDVPPWADKAFGPEDTVTAEIVDYGEVVYYNRFACRSEEDGLTCWDSVDGGGAFMSKEETVLF